MPTEEPAVWSDQVTALDPTFWNVAVVAVAGLVAVVIIASAFRYHPFVPASAAPPVPGTAAATPPVLPLPYEPRSLTVHVISGSFGAGHDAAAHEIAVRFHEAGHDVRRSDVVDLFPAGLGRLLRTAYLEQLRLVPQSWGSLLGMLEPARVAHRVAVRLLALPGRRIEALTTDADLIISTHPFASQALGRLRSVGRIAVPVVTYLTDASVHALWVHPHVDLHLALHEVAAEQARSLGGATTVIETLLPRSCVAPTEEDVTQLRTRLGLPDAGHIVLVVGGSEGVGELEQTALDVASTGMALAVVVCGHNESLRRHLTHRRGLVALGWRTDMPDLLRASDCVIQNAGGFTVLEAHVAEVPVISYRCLPGHGVANAAALERAGLVPWARDPAELRLLLAATLAPDSPVTRSLAGPAADLVTTLVATRVAVAG